MRKASSVLAAAAALLAVQPCAASSIVYSGYNSGLAQVGLSPTPSNPNGSQDIEANPGGGASAVALNGFAQAFPGQNESILTAQADAVPDGNQVFAGQAFAQANVHFTLMNSITGKVDPMGKVDIAIKGSASLGSPTISPDTEPPFATWAVSVGEDSPPPQLTLSYSNGVLIGATMTGGFGPDEFAHASGLYVSNGPGASGYQSDLEPFTQTPGSGLATTITAYAMSDGVLDLDESVTVSGIGYAVLDPVLTPVNPSDILVSSAIMNSNPGAPLFTAAQIAKLEADGVDLSQLESLGLIGGAATPEPGSFALILTGLGLAGLGLRRSRR